MDFGLSAGVVRTAQGQILVEPRTAIENIAEEIRPFIHPLNLYLSPPNGESLLLEDFEALGVRRLKLLRIIEDAELQNKKRGEETRMYLEDRAGKEPDVNELLQLGTLYGNSHLAEIENVWLDKRKRDYLSHFVLRMAYCTTEENRRWLIQQETELLRCRFLQLRVGRNADSLAWFFAASGLDYQQVSLPEKHGLFEELRGSTTFSDIEFKAAGSQNTSYAAPRLAPEEQVQRKAREYTFFKVDFMEALELVKRRDVLLKQGIAYVPDSSIFDVLVNRFRDRLAVSLDELARRMPHQGEENRLLPLFHRITHLYTGKHCEKSSNLKIDLEDLDKLSRQSYPPCMQHLHNTLRKDHHLKHDGRMQYGLFLKGIGLTLEQALTFWRNEFSKAPGMDPAKFDKNYAYNIRHNYGKEGGRKNYTPYSCMKIIMGNEPKAGEAHGCPFRHFDAASLKRLVERSGISTKKQNEVLDKAKEKHYQIACTRYFEAVHGKAEHSAEPINHPNQYFSDSAQHYGYEQQTAASEEKNNNNIDSDNNNPDNKKPKTELDDDDIPMIATDMPLNKNISEADSLSNNMANDAPAPVAVEQAKTTIASPIDDIVMEPATSSDSASDAPSS